MNAPASPPPLSRVRPAVYDFRILQLETESMSPTQSLSPDSAPTASSPPQPDPAQALFQVATGYMVSAALQTVAKLGIADQLAAGPRPVADLARATGANEDALYRMLRALAMFGVFQETQPRTFALTPAAELLKSGPGL